MDNAAGEYALQIHAGTTGAALHQHGRPGYKRAISRALHKTTELQQAIEILLGAFASSILSIKVARLIVPIRHGGHWPQLSPLKKFENLSVAATMQVASSTTILPPSPALFRLS